MKEGEGVGVAGWSVVVVVRMREELSGGLRDERRR